MTGRPSPGRPLFARAAAEDLRQIGDYIAADNPARALSFFAEIRAFCRLLAAQPKLHRLREEFGPGVRLAVHGRYLVLYAQRDGGQVVIERVIHGARDLGSFLVE